MILILKIVFFCLDVENIGLNLDIFEKFIIIDNDFEIVFEFIDDDIVEEI